MAIDPNSSSSSTAMAVDSTTITTIAARPSPNQPPPPAPTRPYLPIRSPNPPSPSPSPAQGIGIPYPVSSSGRLPKGVRPISFPDQAAVTVANPAPAYPHRPLPNLYIPGHVIRSPHNFQQHHQQHYLSHLASAALPIKGLPVSAHPKVASPSSVPDSNGYKDIRDKTKDDSLTIVRDRKVRITEEASLYALCRSWLKNGFSENSQQPYRDTARSLPKPLPIAITTDDVPKKKECEEEEEEEDEDSVNDLLAKDLLKRHVKRAKRVRARLREERLNRISRYKSRLALLLPPLVEQYRNDAAAGH
ncbi:hypothetical protein UlMin_037049 [Ulmus minor]